MVIFLLEDPKETTLDSSSKSVIVILFGVNIILIKWITKNIEPVKQVK